MKAGGAQGLASSFAALRTAALNLASVLRAKRGDNQIFLAECELGKRAVAYARELERWS